MQIDININFDKIKEQYEAILNDTASDMIAEIEGDQVVPYDTGATQKSSKIQVKNNVAELSYNTEYSSKIYPDVGRRFKRIHNKNARARWIENPIYFENAANNLAKNFKKYGD